jgi:hypothetical protein
MSLKLNSSGGGSVTLQEPVTASDLTVNLPATLGNTGNSMQVTSDASGNVGLGVTPSAWNTNYKAIQNGQSGWMSRAGGSDFYLFANSYQEAASPFAFKYINTAPASRYQQDAGSHAWFSAPSGTAGNAITFTQAMTLDASGNLLVGTTSTAVRNLTSGSGARIGPSGQLELAGASDTNYINITAASGTMLEFRRQGPNSVGGISTNGTSTTYATSSDYRLKNTVAPMTGALAKVALLKPCTYKWNADGTDGEGFIAHELAEVCPDAVTGAKDAVDAEGKPVYQGIDTSFLVATVVAAIKELKAELDTVKAELAVLKGTA